MTTLFLLPGIGMLGMTGNQTGLRSISNQRTAWNSLNLRLRMQHPPPAMKIFCSKGYSQYYTFSFIGFPSYLFSDRVTITGAMGVGAKGIKSHCASNLYGHLLLMSLSTGIPSKPKCFQSMGRLCASIP